MPHETLVPSSLNGSSPAATTSSKTATNYGNFNSQFSNVIVGGTTTSTAAQLLHQQQQQSSRSRWAHCASWRMQQCSNENFLILAASISRRHPKPHHINQISITDKSFTINYNRLCQPSLVQMRRPPVQALSAIFRIMTPMLLRTTLTH